MQSGPPAPNRTDIYEKMDKLLKLPRGELAGNEPDAAAALRTRYPELVELL